MLLTVLQPASVTLLMTAPVTGFSVVKKGEKVPL